MRIKLAREVRENIRNESPVWLRCMDEIDVFRSGFLVHIEKETNAYLKYGIASFRIAVPEYAIGNRPLDGVTGNEDGLNAKTVTVSVQNQHENMLKQHAHPMLKTRAVVSFFMPEQTKELLDWMDRLAEYEDPPVIVDQEIDSDWEIIEL